MSSLGETTRRTADFRGRALVRKLGIGWKSVVWQNFGWHAKAVKGGIAVHENMYNGKVEGYTAFIGEIGKPGGRWAASGPTPQLAIRVALIKAEKELAECERIVRAALWEAMIQ